MLTTIEEKLSAIKAINQQKDTIEEMMSLMNGHQYSINRIDVTSDRQIAFFTLTKNYNQKFG